MTLTSKILRKVSGVDSSMVLAKPMPALLIRMLGLPNSLRIAVATSSTCSGTVMSHRRKVMFGSCNVC